MQKGTRTTRCEHGNLPEETYGHINTAFCDGMATTATAAHHFIWRHLYASIQAAQTPTSKLGLSHLIKGVVWARSGRKKSLSRLQQRIADGKGSKHWKNDRCERARKGTLWFRPDMFYENRFWNRRPDGIVINKHHRTLYNLEFKRSSDRNKDFLRVKEGEANEQHRSIIEALRAAARACASVFISVEKTGTLWQAS